MAKTPKILEVFRNWNRRKYDDKKTHYETFSVEKWNSLNESKKKEHRVRDCMGCAQSYKSVRILFPVKCRRLQDISQTINIQQQLSSSANSQRSYSVKEIRRETEAVFDHISNKFESKYSISFAEAIHKSPEINLCRKENRAEKKKAARKQARQHKRKVEEQWQKSDVDVFLGCRQSYSQRQELRMATFYESPKAAYERSLKRKNLEEQGARKNKRHARRWQDIDFDKEGLLQEISKTPTESKVRLSTLSN